MMSCSETMQEAGGCRGIRGATTVDSNDALAMLGATRELLGRIVAENGLRNEDVVSATFTATADLDAAYPAQAAREMGWSSVPLLCAQEMRVEGSLPRCIRVLVLVRTAHEVRHVYLRGAHSLRPDWTGEER